MNAKTRMQYLHRNLRKGPSREGKRAEKEDEKKPDEGSKDPCKNLL